VNLLDWVLILVVVLYAVSGYWQGFITGVFATVGLLIGGLIGVWAAPTALGNASPSILVSLAAVFIVIICASLGQALFQIGGAHLRSKITWQPVRALERHAAGRSARSGRPGEAGELQRGSPRHPRHGHSNRPGTTRGRARDHPVGPERGRTAVGLSPASAAGRAPLVAGALTDVLFVRVFHI